MIIVPHAKPGTALKNKTGSWRDKKPEVNEEKCIRCGLCALHCPDGVIEVDENSAHVDYDYCKGCGICEKLCPVKAIVMKKEQK